mgnify:CR=1 FL=1
MTDPLEQLSIEDLMIINNALNEVCNGMDLGTEFQTRMGVEVEEARALLQRVSSIYRAKEAQENRC